MKSILTSIFLVAFTSVFAQKPKIVDPMTIKEAKLVTSFDKNNIESMVTYYFASRIRKDDKWKEVLPDSSQWSNKMKTCVKTHNTWTFIIFKNLGLLTGKYGTTVKVYFMIEINGRTSDGIDDVELTQENGKWVIRCVPI